MRAGDGALVGDMDAVFRLADRISVMVDGRLIACDLLKDQSTEVRRATGDEVAA